MDFCFSQDLGRLGDFHGQVLTETKMQVRSRTEHARTFGGDSQTDVLYPKIIVRWINRRQCTYPEITEEARIRLSDPRLYGNVMHLVDATGVGVATIDYMRKEGLTPLGITITGGTNVGTGDMGITVPKIELINSLQLALQGEMLEFAQGLDQECQKHLLHEFQNFKEKKTTAGNKTYEAWRESDHDDLILALAINVWWVLREHGIRAIPKKQQQNLNDYDPLLDM